MRRWFIVIHLAILAAGPVGCRTDNPDACANKPDGGCEAGHVCRIEGKGSRCVPTADAAPDASAPMDVPTEASSGDARTDGCSSDDPGDCAKCEMGARRCGPGNTVEVCESSGSWRAERACTGQACVNGTCQGTCEPGTTCGGYECASGQTSGQQVGPGTCNASGICADRSSTPCPGGLGCEGNRCAEECTIGQAGGRCPEGMFCESKTKCSPQKGVHKPCIGLGSGECLPGLMCKAGYCCTGKCLPHLELCTEAQECASGFCKLAFAKVCSNDATKAECGRDFDPPLTIVEYCGDSRATCVDGIDRNKSYCELPP